MHRSRATAPGPSPTTALRLLGDPAVLLPDGSVRALERRAAGLLALVALEPGVTRARAAALLWPQSDDSRKALRQQLGRFRTLFGVALVEGDDTLQLGATVSTDLAHGDAPLLGTLAFEECEAFADWLSAQRAARQSRQTAPMLRELEQAEAGRDYERALALAGQLAALEPDSEVHARAQMRLHYLRGDLAAAQSLYERLRQRLRRRFGAAPSAETEAVARAIAAAAGAAPSARRRGPAVKSVTSPLPAASLPPAASGQPPVTVLRPPRLIGRRRELATLDTAWREGRVALVLGEAGLGKSRLLSEFATGQRIVSVQGRPGDPGVPYAVLARLLREVLQRCAAQVADQRNELARLLPELAPGIELPKDGQRLLLQQAVEALLQNAQFDGALLHGLAIDDLHFADSASVEMLQGLMVAPALAHLHWVLAQRPGEGEPAVERMRRALIEADRLVTLPLAPLTEPDLAELLDSLLLDGLDALDGFDALDALDAPALAGALMRHTGGNPLFALETLKHGLASGGLREGRLPQPQSVGALIELRLTQLSRSALALARLAALAGVDFSIALAERVTGERALALADAWSELQAAQVLRDTGFAHDLVADAVMRQVPPAIARHLHADIAAWLDERGAEPARRALHWQAAGDERMALEALRAAAERARTLGRNEECGRFHLAAATACDRLGRAADAFEHLFTGVNTLSDFLPDAELEPLVRSLEQRASSDGERAAALLMRNHMLDGQRQWQQALACVAEGLPLARASGRTQLEAELLFAQGKCLYSSGQMQAALAPVAQSIDLMERSGRPDYAAAKLKSLATIEESQGRLREADAHLTRARRLQEELSAWGNTPLTLTSQAMLRIQLGDRRGALELLDEEPRRLARQLESQFTSPEAQRQWLKLQLVARTLLGEFASALRLYAERVKGTPHEQDAGVAILAAWLLHHLGRNDLARPLWQRAERGGASAVVRSFLTVMQVREDAALAARLWDGREEIASFGDLFSGALVNGYLAPLAPPAVGLAAAGRLLGRMQQLALPGYLGGLHAAHAAVLARAGNAEAAATAVASATGFLQGAGVFHVPWAWQQCAEAYRLGGRESDARQCALEALGWLRVRAPSLPIEFRGSFEQRQPVHRALLEAARPRR